MPQWEEIRKSFIVESDKSVLPPSVKLPVLPKALSDFRDVAQDPEADVNELSKIVSSDSGLSTELLRNVNSCKSGARVRITSVKQALLNLGISSTQLFLTSTCMQSVMKSTSSKLINFQNFWNVNLERSLLAREIARLVGADPDLAFTGAMLQDFFLPLITNQITDKYLEFATDREQFTSLVEFERKKFGWDHAQAAAQIMYAWKFPDELICCIYYHHHGLAILENEDLAKTSVAAVAISSLIPDALRQELDGLQQLIQFDQDQREINIRKLAKQIKDEFEETSSAPQSHFTLTHLYENAKKRDEQQAKCAAAEA